MQVGRNTRGTAYSFPCLVRSVFLGIQTEVDEIDKCFGILFNDEEIKEEVTYLC